MIPLDQFDLIGLKDGIRSCFSSVFSELNTASEAWLQEKRLLTLGRDNFADFVTRQVGIFPLFGTSRSASIDSSYVALGVSRDIERIRYKSLEEIEQGILREKRGAVFSPERQQQSRVPLEALNSTDSGFALIGSSGSGKTTVFRHLAVEAARGKAVRGRKVIPIYLAVRDMSDSGKGVLEASLDLLEKLDIAEHNRVLSLLFKEGRCLLLLDGLDETGVEHQQRLIRDLSSIMAQYPRSIACVSARPLSLEVGLAGFSKWETLPLDFDKRLGFVTKWFSAVNPQKGDRLFQRCQADSALLDLGSSPLMLSIVCALYENDLDIPKDQDELYSRCVEGLLGGWDAFRNIARNSPLASLSLRKRITFVTWLGAALFDAKKLVFQASDVEELQIIRKVSDFLDVAPIPAEVALTSLFNDFGLLVERSPSRYSFSHLSLHEYATARYYIENRRENELVSSCFRDPRWRDVLRLIAKMLPNADEFMTRISQTVKLHQLNDAEQLEYLLSVRPAMSRPVRLKVYRMVAQRVTGAIPATQFELEFLEHTLVLRPKTSRGWQDTLRKARQVEAEEKKRRDRGESGRRREQFTKIALPSNILLVVNCLEPLMKLLSNSGVLRDIKLDSSFLLLWEAAGWPEIKEVLFEQPFQDQSEEAL